MVVLLYWLVINFHYGEAVTGCARQKVPEKSSKDANQDVAPPSTAMRLSAAHAEDAGVRGTPELVDPTARARQQSCGDSVRHPTPASLVAACARRR